MLCAANRTTGVRLVARPDRDGEASSDDRIEIVEIQADPEETPHARVRRSPKDERVCPAKPRVRRAQGCRLPARLLLPLWDQSRLRPRGAAGCSGGPYLFRTQRFPDVRPVPARAPAIGRGA